MELPQYRVSALCATFACAFLPRPSLAADDPASKADTQTLPAIKVEATDDASSEGNYSTRRTATATGLDLSLRHTPQSVSVITRERMDDQAMTTVADALISTTGLSVKPVDRGRNNLSVRGFDVNNFQLDGVPVPTGNVGLETMNTAIYDRIEVVRGATGLTSGAGDPSAAINLIRKHADSREFSGSVSAELGSWDRRTGTLDVSSPLNGSGTVRGRFVASAGQREAFIDLEDTENTVFYGVIDADLGDSTRLSIGASEQRDERDGILWAGLPYWYSDGTRVTSWDDSDTTAAKWNRWDSKYQSAFATVEHFFSNDWMIRGNATYHAQDEESMLLWLWNDPDPVTGEGMEAWPYHYFSSPEQIHFDVAVTGPFTLLGREHELTVGAMHSDLEDGWDNRDPVGPVAAVGDIRAWDGSFPEPEMGERYVGSAGTTTETAAYAAARLQVTDSLKFIGGGRVSDWERQEDAGAWTPEAYEIRHSGEFTPYAGLVYDFGEHMSAYASVTDSFMPQDYRDRNGNYLDPLLGKSYEAGVKGEFRDGRLNTSLAAFRIDQDNYAVIDEGQPPLPDGSFPYRTSQGVTSEGYELEITGEVLPDWQLSLGWTHYSAKDANDVDVAVDHAREQLKLFTRYALPGMWDGLTIGGGVNWEGDRPATAVNPGTGLEERIGQPSYTLVDLMARYEFGEQLSMQLNVNNALDETYRSGSFWWGAPFTFGPPREVLLAMDYRF